MTDAPPAAPATRQTPVKRVKWLIGAGLVLVLLAGVIVGYIALNGPKAPADGYKLSEGMCNRFDYGAFGKPGLDGKVTDSSYYDPSAEPHAGLQGLTVLCKYKIDVVSIDVGFELPVQGEPSQWMANDEMLVKGVDRDAVQTACMLKVQVQFSQCWESNLHYAIRVYDGNLSMSVLIRPAIDHLKRQASEFTDQLVATMRQRA